MFIERSLTLLLTAKSLLIASLLSLFYLGYHHKLFCKCFQITCTIMYLEVIVHVKRGALGFSALWFWLFFLIGFLVLVFIAVCGFSIFFASGFRFSLKILAVFQFWYPVWFLVFPILSYLGAGFSSI